MRQQTEKKEYITGEDFVFLFKSLYVIENEDLIRNDYVEHILDLYPGSALNHLDLCKNFEGDPEEALEMRRSRWPKEIPLPDELKRKECVA